ncbi:MAG TPA: 1-deoxy-D-xylulose-5-phosphate reductoisomerase, partial [Thermoleophilia bacterium]|nr:1-deoxy-D-xylulose-5-phosphate reductoisomerase [Thermoleophilia bacterium]
MGTLMDAAPPKHVVILGSTGSIGRQAIEVLPCVPQVRLVGLAAETNVSGVLEQAAASGAAAVALRDPA